MKIGAKSFMNLQEAVAWLLENNPLPFQSSANYAGNTEIAFSTLINPSPAKVRVGSIIFFADSKVSTVIGLTSNSFICSDQYNNLVDDIAYVTNVSLNASGHLITTLSDGQTIDAGQIKQVSGFSIDGSQHLIVSYNDGSSTDLGAIFSGNVNIAGNLTADSIIENMTGYTFNKEAETTNITREFLYASAVKNGNKLTFVVAMNITRTGSAGSSYIEAGSFTIPWQVCQYIVPSSITGCVDVKTTKLQDSIYSGKDILSYVLKQGTTKLVFEMYNGSLDTLLDLNTPYYFRYELTVLLSDNMAN